MGLQSDYEYQGLGLGGGRLKEGDNLGAKEEETHMNLFFVSIHYEISFNNWIVFIFNYERGIYSKKLKKSIA